LIFLDFIKTITITYFIEQMMNHEAEKAVMIIDIFEALAIISQFKEILYIIAPN